MQAGIHQRLASLPEHYQSALSRWLAPTDEGSDLSGGEWQKVALARLCLRHPEMLLVDELTTALDAEADIPVISLRLLPGHTCLPITYRAQALDAWHGRSHRRAGTRN
jgi:ATP-binding cassette subfamily B protein